MKLSKKFFALILAANFAFMGLAVNPTNVAYATSTDATEDQKYNQQLEQLKYALNDMTNVVNSNAYFNYASQEAKAEYEKAIGNANILIARVPNVTYQELRDATLRINETKKAVEAEVRRTVQKQKLQTAVENNRIQADAARFLLENAPKKIAHVREELLAILAKSEQLVERAEALLAEM